MGLGMFDFEKKYTERVCGSEVGKSQLEHRGKFRLRRFFSTNQLKSTFRSRKTSAFLSMVTWHAHRCVVSCPYAAFKTFCTNTYPNKLGSMVIRQRISIPALGDQLDARGEYLSR